MKPLVVPGTLLSAEDQRHVLAAFVHRFTREHRPAWAAQPWKDGRPYPVQFDSDRDWLAHTWFKITKAGRLDKRVHHCYSSPTWPDNPELRRPINPPVDHALLAGALLNPDADDRL